METRNKVYLLLILSIVWAAIIFVCCTMPPNNIPKFNIQHIDKAAHFSFFFIQSVLLSLLFYYKTRKNYLQIILLSTLQALIYGGLIEIVQQAYFNRTGDLFDLIADVLGGFSGALIYPAFLKLFK